MTSKVSSLALSWIRFTALAAAGILAYSQLTAAQGFQSGSNPFAEPQAPDTGGEDEADVEEFEAPPQSAIRSDPSPDSGSSGGRSGRGSISVGGKADPKPVAGFQKKTSGLELSGPGSEKGVQSNGEVAPLSVETVSGVGSNEIITDFNFPKADILDIAKTMGRLTGKNFILDKDVRGEVSIISNTSITVGDAWRAFLTALDINSLTVVPSGTYLRIMKQTDAYKKALPMYTNRETPPTDALVTKIFKIKHINAKDLEQPLKSLSGNFQMKLFTLEQTNTLIVTDNASNISRLSKILEFLDIEGFDAGIEVVRVKYASAVEISKLIDQLLPNNSASVPGFRPSGASGRSGFQPRRTRAGGVVNAIIADERSNNLIVHANPMGLSEVKSLVTRLDQKDTVTVGGGRVHVIYLQFADAEEIAKTITTLNQNGGRSGASTGSAGGFGSGAPTGLGVNTSEQNLFEGQIRVAADKPTNSLVVTASPADFSTLQRVVNKLDIPRDQVYVEVIIMEMTSERNSEYAANVLLPGGTIVAPTDDLVKTLINPTNIPQGLVLRWKGGGTNSISIPTAGGAAQSVQIPNLAALLKALQTSSNSNVIATPQLMTLDNTKAIFDSTESIPIPSVNAQLGNVQSGVTYQEVPLKIEITPMINKISNFVKLTIKAVLGDILNKELPSAVQNLAFATLKRSAETQVVVADSDTVVLGGLSRDKNQETTRKVPLLGDIPILGWLFKSKTSSVGKANVMLFITPKIIRQYEGVRTVLDQKLKERDEFVEKTFGGDDTVRRQRDRMIRSLPDVKNLSYKTRAKNTNIDTEDPQTLTLPGNEK